MGLYQSSTVFNQDSVDVDFRVESAANVNKFVIDANEERISVGTTLAASTAGHAAQFGVEGLNFHQSTVSITSNSPDANGAYLVLGKSRGNAVNTPTVVQSADTVGAILFAAADGTDYASLAAEILVQIDTDPGGNDTPGRMVFKTTANGAAATTERMRINNSGSLLFGTTTTTVADQTGSTQGIRLAQGGANIQAASTDIAMYLNRLDSAGPILEFRRDGSEVGRISTENNRMSIGSSDVGLRFTYGSTDRVEPFSPSGNAVRDDAMDLGNGSSRFDNIFATNSTISTSDRNEKQDIAALTSAEMLVAKRISPLFKTFRWKTKVAAKAAKGETARTHTGIIAQDVQAAFEAESLDAGDYSMFISTTWWEHDVDVAAFEGDDTAEPAIEAKDAYTRTDTYDTEDEAPSGSTKKIRLGIRYPELLSFLAAYNEQRFAAIETRLTALEG
tara:strand:+ start:23 stop:1363 length:1341 start_codon:yes stop_codon:yes gene_type:complete